LGLSAQPKNIFYLNIKKETHTMETTFFRGIVLLLALTGFGASRSASTGVHTPVAHAKTDPSGPTPVCPPNDPNGCGIL